MKSSRFKYEYRENASKLHKAVGDTLRSSGAFGNYSIYQEYPVSKVNPACKNGRLHFDWVIPKLRVVFEAMGEQHYKPVNFGGKLTEDDILKWQDMVWRDKKKKEAALAVGWVYVEVSYTETITEERLVELFTEASSKVCIPKEESIGWKETSRRRAREYNRKAYQKAKEWRSRSD